MIAKRVISGTVSLFIYYLSGVSPFFPGSSGIWLEVHPLAIDTVVTLGQGELQGKVHLSHRCFALQARNGSRLRRR
jgi:hypothetical protein